MLFVGSVAVDSHAGGFLVGYGRFVGFEDVFCWVVFQLWAILPDVVAVGVPFFAECDGAWRGIVSNQLISSYPAAFDGDEGWRTYYNTDKTAHKTPCNSTTANSQYCKPPHDQSTTPQTPPRPAPN